MAVTAKERGSRSTKRKRSASVLEQLVAGCEAERVAIHFLDGRLLEGALLFNPIKRSGKLINVEQEFSLDFEPLEVKEIKVLQNRQPSAPPERPESKPGRESRGYGLDEDPDDDD